MLHVPHTRPKSFSELEREYLRHHPAAFAKKYFPTKPVKTGFSVESKARLIAAIQRGAETKRRKRAAMANTYDHTIYPLRRMTKMDHTCTACKGIIPKGSRNVNYKMKNTVIRIYFHKTGECPSIL